MGAMQQLQTLAALAALSMPVAKLAAEESPTTKPATQPSGHLVDGAVVPNSRIDGSILNADTKISATVEHAQSSTTQPAEPERSSQELVTIPGTTFDIPEVRVSNSAVIVVDSPAIVVDSPAIVVDSEVIGAPPGTKQSAAILQSTLHNKPGISEYQRTPNSSPANVYVAPGMNVGNISADPSSTVNIGGVIIDGKRVK